MAQPVGLGNRYDMLEDEGAEKEAEFQPVQKSDKKTSTHKAQQKPRSDAPRGGNAQRAAAPEPEAASAPTERRRDDRASKGGKGGGKGSRGGNRPRDHDGKDRQSYKPRESDKRVENGPGSWGKPDETANAEEGAEEGESKREPRVLTAEQEEAAEKARKEREEEEKQMTLEEYRARQTAVTRELPKARKPNEGSDDKNFAKKATLLTKETEDFYSGKKTEQKTKVVKEKKETEKILFEPKSYQEESRDSRQRSRGDGAGRGGRGGSQRGNRPPRSAPPPQATDEAQFPTLGKK